MSSDDIEWVETKDPAGNKSGITTLALKNVQGDAEYTCEIKVDGTWVKSAVRIDIFGKIDITNWDIINWDLMIIIVNPE